MKCRFPELLVLIYSALFSNDCTRRSLQLLVVLHSFLSYLRFLYCTDFVDSWTMAKQADADGTQVSLSTMEILLIHLSAHYTWSVISSGGVEIIVSVWGR